MLFKLIAESSDCDFKEKLEDSEKKVVSLEEELSIIKQENDLLRKELEPAKLASLGKILD